MEIENLLKGSIPAGVDLTATDSVVKEKARLLPTTCPGCGGPLRSDEVDWADEATAECPYCGGSVRAE